MALAEHLRQRAAGRFQWAGAWKVLGTVFKPFGNVGHYLSPIFHQIPCGTMCLHELSCIRLLAMPWTHRAPLSMELSRQEYWNELPFPTAGGLPDPGIKPQSHSSPSAGGFFTPAPPGKPLWIVDPSINLILKWESRSSELSNAFKIMQRGQGLMAGTRTQAYVAPQCEFCGCIRWTLPHFEIF